MVVSSTPPRGEFSVGVPGVSHLVPEGQEPQPLEEEIPTPEQTVAGSAQEGPFVPVQVPQPLGEP